MLNKKLLRGATRQSGLKGFSLIELMIAIAILAIALLGIFQAYSVGFMGMADARDRTVATNYLREMIEDFKNMDFKKVKDEPITVIPGTKFHRGALVLDLEEKDGVTNLKKVITQVRWMDRRGNIKTEEASTILYSKPKTSEVSNAAGIVLYAQPYYTILPNMMVTLTAEIKDNNDNTISDWEGDITFSVITDPPNDTPVGYISPDPQTVHTTDGTTSIIFYAIDVEEGVSIEGIEKIQAFANLEVIGNVNDTVNIKVSTGAVGIILEPVEGNDIIPVGETATINVYIVKANYDINDTIVYSDDITLNATVPGTLSTTTINGVPSGQTTVTLTSTGTPGVVEITASSPDLDMGYTEVTFTGEANSILVSPKKNSIYPGEEIDITITIVDENNTPIGFSGTVTLDASPDYGIFDDTSNPISLSFTEEDSLKSIFKASLDSPVGEVITIRAISGDLTGSTDINILNPLTPYYLKLFAFPSSVDVDGAVNSTAITATIYDDNYKKVTTYDEAITFIAKDEDGNDFGNFSDNFVIPSEGEVTVELSSSIAGTATITASSGSVILTPEGGIEVVFYESAKKIVLSAYPLSIQADGKETSIIRATICDEGGNKVANYNEPITFITTQGNFSNDSNTITVNDWDEGEVTVELSSSIAGTATITAFSGSLILTPEGGIEVVFTVVIPTELTLGYVINWDDYNISFGIIITGSSLNLEKMEIEWDNSNATLDEIKINSPYPGDLNPKIIKHIEAYSICIIESISKELLVGDSYIRFTFSGSEMKNENITVTFTDENGVTYEVSFIVPN